MASTSKIEWCDSTFNPWIGCTKVSPACDNCYASVSTPARALNVEWGVGHPRRRTAPGNWALPRRWNARTFWQCAACGWRGEDPKSESARGRYCPNCFSSHLEEARRRVFCASLADVFDNEVDPQWRIDLLELIAATPNLDWLLLTKRIGNAERLLDQALDVMSHGLTRWRDAPWPNVWIGATIVNQAEADRDAPKLLALPAEIRFLSMEPLLGPVDLNVVPPPAGSRPVNGASMADISGCLPRWQEHPVRAKLRDGIDWVIVGGESGPHARPMAPDWARDLRDQCTAAAVPFLFKQWGEWGPIRQPISSSAPLESYGILGDMPMLIDQDDIQHGGLIRCGKKNAGRLLDGRTWNGVPVARE